MADDTHPLKPCLLKRMEAIQKLDLAPGPKAVLVWLAFHAGESWPTCYPKVGTLVRDTGMSERTVQRHLATLESAGLIETTDRARDHLPNLYRLKLAVGTGQNDRRPPRQNDGYPPVKMTPGTKNYEQVVEQVDTGGESPTLVDEPTDAKPPKRAPAAQTNEEWLADYGRD